MISAIGIGAGGHARVIIDILRCAGEVEIVGLVDRDPAQTGRTLEGAKVLGTDALLPELLSKNIKHVFIGVGGVGDNSVRARLYAQLREMGFTIIKAVHPRA